MHNRHHPIYSKLIEGRSSDPDKASNICRHVEALFGQAGDLIKQMEVEVRSNDAATRKVLQEKVNGYKKSMSNMKADFNAAREQADRESLLGGSAGKSLEQRQRLLDTNEK